MKLPDSVIKVAQHAAGTIPDGIVGPKTLAALREYDDECADFDFARDVERLVVVVAQHAAGLTGRGLDGIYGPNTAKAVQAYCEEHDLAVPRPQRARTRMAVWEPHEGPGEFQKDGIDLRDPTVIVPKGGMERIPDRGAMKSIYGDAERLGKDGIQRRLVKLEGLPGRFNRGNGILYGVHERVASHMRLALELCHTFGVVGELYRIGTFNYRHMRHDPDMPLSFHSYGICVDLNPRENHAWVPGGEDHEIAPFSPGWWQKYPRGLSEVAVLCFKKAGFAWGGDWRSFRDPMHFELVAPS